MPHAVDVSLVTLIIEATSTANIDTDEDAALLAQAELIKDNPDSFLPVEELDVVMA